MAKGLARQVAEIINEPAFSLTPEIYGLKTEQEMLERTMVGGARADALRMAKQIVKLVRAHQ